MLEEKNWNKALEGRIMDEWRRKSYEFTKDGRKVFSIDTPPPYVNTPIHIGHATTYTLMDMFARFHRMIGDSVIFPLGLDRNGLPIEMAAEKKFGKPMHSVSREEFIGLCRKVLEESSAESIDSFRRLGISFNSWETGKEIGKMYHTDSDDYRQLTQETFIDLWKDGMIYEGSYYTNFDTKLRTTVADAEIIYEDVPTFFNDIIFTVAETGEKLVIGTTRPELLASCAMVIYNPEDKRYRHLKGKTAITPVYDKQVPIVAHTQADMEKGTGLVMMCSFGDTADIRFFRELKITPVISINYDGRMNENAGFLKGLKIEEARKAIIEKLKESGMLVKQAKIMHRTPLCERSKHPIEFIATRELYLKQTEIKEKIRETSSKMRFYSEKSRQMLLDWIDTISIDWPITRKRYYATEVPMWHCRKCGSQFVPEKGRYYRPWKEACPVKCNCGAEYEGDERVFDTWFDSSISPLYIMKWNRDDEFFWDNFPCTLRPQGKEIIRTWLYYTILKCYLLTKKPAFKDVFIHYHITDNSGKKMSKSIGNVIDPHKILEKYGAEPFRLWTATEGDLSKGDLKCSFDRIDGAVKTLTKLWNVARFVTSFGKAEMPEKLEEADKWIISEVDMLIETAEKYYMEYNFHEPAIQLKSFLWETFASHYIEMVKNRAYKGDASALYTLNYCLEAILKLMSPIIPFVTYAIYKDMTGNDIHDESFPKKHGTGGAKFTTAEIISINSAIWKIKKDSSKSLKEPVSSVTITGNMTGVEADLISMHNIQNIMTGKEVKIEL